MKVKLEEDVVIKASETVKQGTTIVFGACKPEDLSEWLNLKGIKNTEHNDKDLNTAPIGWFNNNKGFEFPINDGKPEVKDPAMER